MLRIRFFHFHPYGPDEYDVHITYTDHVYTRPIRIYVYRSAAEKMRSCDVQLLTCTIDALRMGWHDCAKNRVVPIHHNYKHVVEAMNRYLYFSLLSFFPSRWFIVWSTYIVFMRRFWTNQTKRKKNTETTFFFFFIYTICCTENKG